MKKLKITKGMTLICIEPKVLHGYYDSQFKGETLTVMSEKVPYVTKMPGSQYFARLGTGLKTKTGHNQEFSVGLHELTDKNFIIV